MFKEIKIDNKIYRITDNPDELFLSDQVKRAYTIITDCMNTIYCLTKKYYPKIVKPHIFFSDSNEINASTYRDSYIIIYSGLIMNASDLIKKRYTKDVLKKYGIFQKLSIEAIHSSIEEYLWKYIFLHELYHIWHSHFLWKRKYKFDTSGILIQQSDVQNLQYNTEQNTYSGLVNYLEPEDVQKNITQQALELDSDSCAVSMLTNLLMLDTDEKIKCGQKIERAKYIRTEMGLIMGALATAFCLLDGNAGAKFEEFKDIDLNAMTHPIPSIRMFYAEEVADAILYRYFPNSEEHFYIEEEWLKIICDVEPYFKGKIEMGRVFYYTAYTEKAQLHLVRLKQRITDMYDSINLLASGNMQERLAQEDIGLDQGAIWFTEDGASLKGWKNPS